MPNENQTQEAPNDYVALRQDLIDKLNMDRNVASSVAATLLVEERLSEIVTLIKQVTPLRQAAHGDPSAATPPTPGIT